MGSMQIQDVFEPYYEAKMHSALRDKTRFARQERQASPGLKDGQTDPSADVAARLARCRDALARSLSKREAER